MKKRMCNLITDYINQIQNYQTVTIQPKRSNIHTFVLKTKTTSVTTLSKPPLAPLNIVYSCSLSSTNFNSFQTRTIFNVTANQCQTLCQPHTAHNKARSAFLHSKSSTVNPVNPFSVKIQNLTVRFVAMKIKVKAFDGLDHLKTLEKFLNQIDAHTTFSMGKQHIDMQCVGYMQ